MAIHALWEDRYGLSVRKSQIDLSDLTGSSDTSASHDNTGAQTGTGDSAGKRHFQSISGNGGEVIGQVTAANPTDYAGHIWIFGLPVTGNPGVASGQETIEVQKTDGFATQRVGGQDEASDIFRAGQNPTASFDFVATGKSLIHVSSLFFQNGLKEDADAKYRKVAVLPSNTDGAEPLYYGTFLRKISSNADNSHMLSDSIASSLSLRATQTEPLTASATLNGRLAIGDADISSFQGTPSEATMFGLDGNRNYLLQDSLITFEADGGQDIIMACESFDISMTAEVTPNRFNTFFPINMVLGNYTVEGSFTVPMLGKGANADLNYDYFMGLLTDAGVSGTGQESFYTPKLFTVNWLSTDVNHGHTGENFYGALNTLPGQKVNFKDTTIAGTALESASTSSVTIAGNYEGLFGGSGGAGAGASTTHVAVIEITDDAGNRRDFKVQFNQIGGTAEEPTTELNFETNAQTAPDFSTNKASVGNKVRIITGSAFDLTMRCNAVITDCTVGGATEATMTISFRAMNQFIAGTDTLSQDAFYMEFRDDINGEWGFNTFA